LGVGDELGHFFIVIVFIDGVVLVFRRSLGLLAFVELGRGVFIPFPPSSAFDFVEDLLGGRDEILLRLRLPKRDRGTRVLGRLGGLLLFRCRG